MTRALVTIPAETDLLCEGCGYVLNGLPLSPDARCPECGKATADSDPALRQPAAWEQSGGVGDGGHQPAASAPRRFLTTTARVLFRPTRFYRTFATRPNEQTHRASRWFARIHGLLASALFGAAAYTHVSWFGSGRAGLGDPAGDVALVLLCSGLCYAGLTVTTYLAARLTVWEAAYRGYRLPLPVVRHGLHYHHAHYLPVALLVAATVIGFNLAFAQGWLSGTSGPTYLYVLSAEVVLAAVYLFKTYWIGMRNMMYANA